MSCSSEESYKNALLSRLSRSQETGIKYSLLELKRRVIRQTDCIEGIVAAALLPVGHESYRKLEPITTRPSSYLCMKEGETSSGRYIFYGSSAEGAFTVVAHRIEMGDGQTLWAISVGVGVGSTWKRCKYWVDRGFYECDLQGHFKIELGKGKRKLMIASSTTPVSRTGMRHHIIKIDVKVGELMIDATVTSKSVGGLVDAASCFGDREGIFWAYPRMDCEGRIRCGGDTVTMERARGWMNHEWSRHPNRPGIMAQLTEGGRKLGNICRWWTLHLMLDDPKPHNLTLTLVRPGKTWVVQRAFLHGHNTDQVDVSDSYVEYVRTQSVRHVDTGEVTAFPVDIRLTIDHRTYRIKNQFKTSCITSPVDSLDWITVGSVFEEGKDPVIGHTFGELHFEQSDQLILRSHFGATRTNLGRSDTWKRYFVDL